MSNRFLNEFLHLADPKDFDLPDKLDIYIQDSNSVEADTSTSTKAYQAILKKEKKDLTKEDIKYINSLIKSKRSQLLQMKAKTAELKNFIDSDIKKRIAVTGTDTGNIEISSAIVKKAIKRVFGKKQQTITYEMYKEALEALEQLDPDEAKEYVKGDWYAE